MLELRPLAGDGDVCGGPLQVEGSKLLYVYVGVQDWSRGWHAGATIFRIWRAG